MKSVSGIRGIVGTSLDVPTLTTYATAFGHFVKNGTIVIGRDGRPSGQAIRDIVAGVLSMVGCRVIDLGIVPTPTVELAVLDHRAAGGIAITASHNPIEWNALKFFNADGEFITKTQYDRLEKLISVGKFTYQPHNKLGAIEYDDEAIDRHIKDVLKIAGISRPRIKKARLKVVVDAINGAGSFALPKLLDTLGVKYECINCKGDGDFFRKPEPVPEALTQLGRAVRKYKADIGLACDPDADRLALVDEKGKPIGEELTLALAVAYYLLKNKGPVAINMSTSRVTADMARMVGCPVYLSPVGEANVVEEMRKRKAVIGGEGNGGVIVAECHYGRDALVGTALILSYLAESGKALSNLAGTLPTYYNIKKKAPLPAGFDRKISRVEKAVADEFGKVNIDRRDGLRFDLAEGWIQIRKSNTEPIYRLIAEATSNRLAAKMVATVQRAFK